MIPSSDSENSARSAKLQVESKDTFDDEVQSSTGYASLPCSTAFHRPDDPLRRDFLAECLDHVARVATNACHAITVGDDRLFETQIELMRTTMREAMKTYKELKDASNG